MKKIARHSILFFTVFLFAGSCAMQKNPVSGNQRMLAYSWEEEVQIGQQVDQEFVAQYGLYEDDQIAEYVTELGQTLLAESHMRREDTDQKFRETEFYFKVLDNPVVNAFALPGGYVYVTRGLLSHLNNEAQLAVVIGHEIGHVAARHASQRAFQQQLGQIAVLGGAILGQELLGLPGGSLLNLSSQAAQLIFLSYSRDAERESDRLGVEYSAMTGYEAAEGSEFFRSLERISEESGQSIPTMLSSHPDPGEREETIVELAQNWEEEGYEQNVRNQDEYLDVIDGMVFGQNPRQGFVENSRFVHPDLAFQFPVPEEWQVINEPSQVVLVSPAEDAVVIMQIDNESQSARGSVEQLLEQEAITVNAQAETQSSGRYPAYQADVNISQEEGDLRGIIYALEFDNNIYRFVNYTPVNSFENYSSVFTQVPSEFDELEDQEILDVQPVTLQIIRTDQSQTFSDLLPQDLPMDISPEDIAIINQVELDETIPSGTAIKIPVQ